MAGVRDFEIIPATGEENVSGLMTPEETVCTLAVQKCREIAECAGAGDVIIGADTLVCLAGNLLGKPKNNEDAYNMLMELSGRVHTVYTGVAVISCPGKELVDFEATKVFFRKITEDEARAYVRTGEPADKAGAYGAQGRASIFIERIEGDFFNVVGLPLCKTAIMLSEMGVKLL